MTKAGTFPLALVAWSLAMLVAAGDAQACSVIYTVGDTIGDVVRIMPILTVVLLPLPVALMGGKIIRDSLGHHRRVVRHGPGQPDPAACRRQVVLGACLCAPLVAMIVGGAVGGTISALNRPPPPDHRLSIC